MQITVRFKALLASIMFLLLFVATVSNLLFYKRLKSLEDYIVINIGVEIAQMKATQNLEDARLLQEQKSDSIASGIRLAVESFPKHKALPRLIHEAKNISEDNKYSTKRLKDVVNKSIQKYPDNNMPEFNYFAQ